MRLLLDTHTFLWSVDDDPKLSSSAWSLIEAADAQLEPYSALVQLV